MLENRDTPRKPEKEPCVVCNGKGYVIVKLKGGDRATTICDVCRPPKSSNK